MSRRRKDLKKKVASLSALGAGVLVFGAGEAEAGIIYSGAVNAQVGFSSGNSSYAIPTLGLAFGRFGTTYGSSGIRSVYARGSAQLAVQGFFLQLFSAGAMWNQASAVGNSAVIGGRRWGIGSSSSGSGGSSYYGSYARAAFTFPVASKMGLDPFNDKYALFQFNNGQNTLYGWVQLSYAVSASFGPDPQFGPDLTIHSWAYDDTGASIAAGDTGQNGAQTPEPGTMASTGLAAVALGAAGLRQWRKTRKAA